MPTPVMGLCNPDLTWEEEGDAFELEYHRLLWERDELPDDDPNKNKPVTFGDFYPTKEHIGTKKPG
jgi:hypothetical protein